MPSEPLLFASLRNRYILKCVDGVYVDGKNTGKYLFLACLRNVSVHWVSNLVLYLGLSARIHRSLHKRDNWPGAVVTSDDTWLTVHPR
jgi:hypothetical protein